MSFTEPEVEGFDEPEEESPRDLRKQLGRQTAENERLRQELANRDRDLAFSNAKLPATPMAEFFRKNYDGEPSEEAVRTAAAELGLIGSPSAETQSQVEGIDAQSETAGGGGFLMPQDRMEAMHAEMRLVRPGPFAGKEIELISQKYGMPTGLDDT